MGVRKRANLDRIEYEYCEKIKRNRAYNWSELLRTGLNCLLETDARKVRCLGPVVRTETARIGNYEPEKEIEFCLRNQNITLSDLIVRASSCLAEESDYEDEEPFLDYITQRLETTEAVALFHKNRSQIKVRGKVYVDDVIREEIMRYRGSSRHIYQYVPSTPERVISLCGNISYSHNSASKEINRQHLEAVNLDGVDDIKSTYCKLCAKKQWPNLFREDVESQMVE